MSKPNQLLNSPGNQIRDLCKQCARWRMENLILMMTHFIVICVGENIMQI